jgi:CheY-like chemotaxis protein
MGLFENIGNKLDIIDPRPLQSNQEAASVKLKNAWKKLMARIGLLEDNIRISKLCATMLGYAGHEVTIYADADECLQALFILDPAFPHLFPHSKTLDARPLPIDVLILDLHLPNMDGLEIIHILRSCSHTCALPLIFCTAAAGLEVSQAFAIAPDATLVEKPFKLQSLVSAISEVFPSPF